MTEGDGAPTDIDAAEADALFAALAGYDTLVLAVSGGADSTALMHLAHAWNGRAAGASRRLIVATVDHGLRAASADEAASVARAAGTLGLDHRTLRWLGPKPTTGIQAAAREARYGLLHSAAIEAASHGERAAIVTAHTADDQAETLLMRLARGAGIDGLAGIPARSVIERPAPLGLVQRTDVLRPLLAIGRQRLLGHLAANAIPYIDDPSNSDRRFERVRIRDALAVLEGLGFTRAGLARTAMRMQRAKRALDADTDRLQAQAVTCVPGVMYQIDRAALEAAPAEIGIRLLRRVLGDAGGTAPPAGLTAIEDACARLRTPASGRLGFTLGGCIVETSTRRDGQGELVRVYREPDRDGGLPSITLTAGEGGLWDRRFRVDVATDHSGTVDVGPLAADWPRLVSAHPNLAKLSFPAAAARGLPAFRVNGEIVAVPYLATFVREIGDGDAAAALAGPLSAAAGPAAPASAATTPRYTSSPVSRLTATNERDP